MSEQAAEHCVPALIAATKPGESAFLRSGRLRTSSPMPSDTDVNASSISAIVRRLGGLVVRLH